jgi:glyceraldehyde 3-phosphate dehydrogenase
VPRRLVMRAAPSFPNITIVAVNDPFIPTDYMRYMFKYDTVHGRYPGEVAAGDGEIFVDGKSIKVFNERDPSNIAWGSVGADYVIESTGIFTTVDKCQARARFA